MVGTGRNGCVSVLARCTLVKFADEDEDDDEDDNGKGRGEEEEGEDDESSSFPSSIPRMKALYDVYVRPDVRVTDYRTEYSGIDRDTFRAGQNVRDDDDYGDGGGGRRKSGENNIPVISRDRCRREMAAILNPSPSPPTSEEEGEAATPVVVVVGHALRNDFDVLGMRVSFL